MPHTAQPFDPLAIPIGGTALIEASAGTGKTYGIAALFTRLILLEKLPVDKVLVVTFTKAATAELKTRLRARLDEALRRIRGDATESPADPFMQKLLAQAAAQEPRERLEMRLKAALSQFDNAAIYTIHGFCQRILGDYAFLCQVPFDTELDENGRRELETYAQDFWRLHVAPDPQNARLAFEAGLLPDTLLQEFSRALSRPDLVFRRPQTDLAQAEAAAAEEWQAFRQQFADACAAFRRIHPVLNGSKFRKSSYEDKFAELARLVQTQERPSEKIVSLLQNSNGEDVFSPEYLARDTSVKKGCALSAADIAALSPFHRVRQAAAALTAASRDALTALQLDFLQYVRQTADAQRQTRQTRSPDDLLLDLYHALTAGAHSEQLAQTVAQNWPFALIDEFQDTDPLQYEIFRRIFVANGRPLFLVGDPKQAIYGFRGADIHAYLQAAADTPNRYTLAHNYRSHSRLTDTVGSLFTRKNRPFVLEGIAYPAVSAPRAESRVSPPQPAVRVRWLHGADETEANKDTLRQRAADYCADEIAALLNLAAEGRLNVNGCPAESGQIAVLVHSHNQGRMVKRALAARNIRSVSVQRESVFQSPEAQALAALLDFWLEPRRAEPLRFVLGGVLFSRTAQELYELNRNEKSLSEHIAAAEQCREIWQRQGIYAALTAFARRYGLETRLLAQRNERSLTNFWQLAELLAAEDEAAHSPPSLRNWLLSQMQDASAAENTVLRLESDEALVKIVTIHASKGLQYPFVFCPFSWDTSEARGAMWHILRREHGSELLAAAQLGEADQNQLADEDLGERLRLLYVALTRAEEQLVLYAAACKSKKNSRLNTFAYLLAGRPDDTRAQVQTACASVENPAALLRQNWLDWIDAAPANAVLWQESAPPAAVLRPSRPRTSEYRAAEYPPRRFEFVRHTSFTGLTRSLAHSGTQDETADEMQPALDNAERLPLPESAPDAPAAYDIFHFPQGAQAGVCLHEILEKHRFGRPAAEQHPLIADTLERYGYGAEWLPAVAQTVQHTADADLWRGDTLAALPGVRRISETGFVMHFDQLDTGRLKNSLAAAGLSPACLAAAEKLDFGTLKGFLNGYIDMTCLLSDGQPCVIDYKSNHLGHRPEDYAPAALDAAMAEHHYYLQAWIYALAAARMLQQRRHPVSTVRVRYLFLRGLNGAGQGGIWQWDIAAQHLTPWL
ncbi:TPA: exodeoxyribonuclease V subunit beta [Neisseria bacilliformis]